MKEDDVFVEGCCFGFGWDRSDTPVDRYWWLVSVDLALWLFAVFSGQWQIALSLLFYWLFTLKHWSLFSLPDSLALPLLGNCTAHLRLGWVHMGLSSLVVSYIYIYIYISWWWKNTVYPCGFCILCPGLVAPVVLPGFSQIVASFGVWLPHTSFAQNHMHLYHVP